MKFKIKEFYSLDSKNSLEEFTPENPLSFELNIRISIGPEDLPGSDLFYVLVCTPDFVQNECARNGFWFGLHTLVVAKYEYSMIFNFFEKLVSGCSGESWEEVAEKLNKYMAWEFDGYPR